MTFWRTAQVGAIDLNRPGASGKPPVPAKRQALAEQLALRAGRRFKSKLCDRRLQWRLGLVACALM